MSAPTTDAPQKAAPQKKMPAVKLELSGDPRVQLLPPSVRNRAVARSRIRTGVLLVILGAIIAGALVGYGVVRSQQAQQALLDAQNRGTELLAQQAQYSEAVALDRLVTQAKLLQQGATETEIDYGPLIEQLIDMLPKEASILDISGVTIMPWSAIPAIDGLDAAELKQAGLVATIDLTLNTQTVQDGTNYSRAMRTVTGVLASSINTLGVGTDGVVTSQVSLLLGLDAVSGRFVVSDEAEGGDVGSDADPADDETTGEEG